MHVTRHVIVRRALATTLALLIGVTTVNVVAPESAEADVYCNEQRPLPREAVDRISGPDRYTTAVAISKATYSPRQCNIFVASGADYPDALAGATVAAGSAFYGGGPMLLVQPNGVPASVRAEILRLKPWQVIVLGGRGAISDAVANELATLAEGGMMRMGGSDRYETAAELYHGSARTGGTVYIASGQSFPDALAGAPLAGRTRSPLLLVARAGIPTSIRTRLSEMKPSRIVILGGTGAVSSDVERGLRSYAPSVTRIAGADRYSTAVEISKTLTGVRSTTVYIASGRNYPDALAAGPAAAGAWAPVLLVEPDGIPAVVDTELKRLTPSHIIVLGGTGAVSAGVEQQLKGYLTPLG